jgi:hypothetical protein
MPGKMLRFDFLKIPGRHSYVLFPLLFFLALCFPPLLLFILVFVFYSLIFFSKAVFPALTSAPSGFNCQPSPRSPPF